MGFFKGREDAEKYVEDLEALHQNPDRKDLAWKLGIDADVMDDNLRTVEVVNWIRHLVLPRKQNIDQ
jgi:GMP synthase (glutamine-hydrolysing)